MNLTYQGESWSNTELQFGKYDSSRTTSMFSYSMLVAVPVYRSNSQLAFLKFHSTLESVYNCESMFNIFGKNFDALFTLKYCVTFRERSGHLDTWYARNWHVISFIPMSLWFENVRGSVVTIRVKRSLISLGFCSLAVEFNDNSAEIAQGGCNRNTCPWFISY